MSLLDHPSLSLLTTGKMSASFWSIESLLSRGEPAAKLCGARVSQRVFGQTVGVRAQLGQLQTEVSSSENCPRLWCRPEAAGWHGGQHKPPLMLISVSIPEAQSPIHSFPLEAAVLGHIGFWLLKRTGWVANGCHKVRFSCVCICVRACTRVRMSKWWRWVFTCVLICEDQKPLFSVFLCHFYTLLFEAGCLTEPGAHQLS